ncbi:MAG: hypothetical protein PHN88_11535 [Ignavibacteria bacterium]|nr:hypothetical protein [Ignavibacteria bacterium]
MTEKRNHKKKKSKKDEELLLPDEPVIEDETSEDSEESFDEDEFISQVSELSKNRKKVKLKTVFEVLGKPKKFLSVKSNGKLSKQLYNELLAVLEVKGIMVHFKLDYSLDEKFRFITEEIFSEGVEDLGKKNHINFIYEDFHPEKLTEDDEDDDFLE